MDPKEALEKIKVVDCSICDHPQLCEYCAFKYAIDALEKQIPKKPETGAAWYVCPSCKHAMPVQRECCDNCGQAIDWSDYDD